MNTFTMLLVSVGLLVAAIAGLARQSPPDDSDFSTAIAIEATSVPLNPQSPGQTAVGEFQYAGGLVLTSRDTNQLHGVSDLVVLDTDKLIAVTDFGRFLEARLVFDAADRLVGVADARITPLRDEGGTLPSDKSDVDAEGLAVLPGGDRVVSFERRHRILRYPARGGVPRRVPSPEEVFPLNAGLEALAADPEAGHDAYIVGAEISGSTWNCRLDVTCTKGRPVEKPIDFGLVSLRRLPGDRTAYLLRSYDQVRGSRVVLQIVDRTTIARMDLAAPLTVDNFEGVAIVERRNGGFRFYLISDDNASSTQRTLLMAFDWGR